MLTELPPKNFIALRELFSQYRFTIEVEAILQGTKQGRIFVDTPNSPQMGLIWDLADGVFIINHSQSEESFQEISEVFQKILLPTALEKQSEFVFVIYILPAKWNRKVASLFPASWDYTQEEAMFFALEKFPVNVGPLVSINESLINEHSLKMINMDRNYFQSDEFKSYRNYDEIYQEIESDWGSVEHFYSNGLGTVLISQERQVIGGWCYTGNIVNGIAELGIEVDEQYFQQGLGTILGSQLISQCQNRHLVPHWYCFSSNTASVRLAEKLGFTCMKKFEVHVSEFQGESAIEK
jgi:RimJ/RimL family protein N-acetyltransferase